MPEIGEFIGGDLLTATTELLAEVDKYDVSQEFKAELFANILLERMGSSQRRFSYANALDASKPGCKAEYERTLAHRDWVNGEDVVDAEEFNERWAQTQADLDAAAKDAATALSCLAELRQQLATMFEEIRGEINTIHADIHALKDQETRPPLQTGPFFPPVGTWPPIQPIPLPGWGPRPIDPGFNPGVIDPVIDPDNITFHPGFNYTPMYALGGGALTPIYSGITPLTQPGAGHHAIGSVGGMAATRLADAQFNGEDVEVWTTPIGTLLTPISKVEDTKEGYVDPRIEISGLFNAWATENKGAIAEKLGNQGFRADELEKAFGDQTIGRGIRVADALKGFSSSAKFKDAADLSSRFMEEQASSVRKSGASMAAKIGTVGVVTGDAPAKNASIDNFSVLDNDARAALKAGGVNTIGKLSTTNPRKIQQILAAKNINANASAIAGWQGIAGTVVKLG